MRKNKRYYRDEAALRSRFMIAVFLILIIAIIILVLAGSAGGAFENPLPGIDTSGTGDTSVPSSPVSSGDSSSNESDPPGDVTDPPGDVTDPPGDVTDPPGDVTDPPGDVTDPPGDVTDPPPIDPDLPDLPGVNWEEIKALSNQISGWGPGTQTDELNRPLYSIWGEQKWGKYDADYVRNETSDKVIYLTFDCGYENGYTPLILDVLKEYNVKAVFFITSPYAKTEPELVRRMIDEGHIVGNHSVTHPEAGMPSLTLKEQVDDVMKLHDYVKQHFGYEMWLFRYPAGLFSDQSLALLQALGYRSVFWSFAHADWNPNNQPDPDSSLEKVLDSLHPGAIYLLHAVSATNTAILPDFIEEAQARGYTFAESY